jgi:hypothetical protein
MNFAYLAACLIMLTLWIFLYIRRKDLHKEMIFMSLLASPLGLFDFLAVPLYWQPVTLFNVPIGFEGIFYSFCLGGITAVLYSEVARKTPRHLHKYHKSSVLIVFAITLAVLIAMMVQRTFNPAVTLYCALLVGIGISIYIRKDLLRGTIVGALCFGIAYFIMLKIWMTFYPETVEWFLFTGLPKMYVLDVPLWELLFGIIFAAYWGNIYELLFGYKLVDKRLSRRAKKVRA